MSASIPDQGNMANTGFLINKAAQGLKWKLAQRLIPYDITVAQWSVLHDIAVREQLPHEQRRTSPAQIAERLEMDRPTLSGIMERLHKKELLSIEVDSKDRRYRTASLTPASRSLMVHLEGQSQLVVEEALSGMSRDQIAAMHEGLSRIILNLSGESANEG